MAKYEFLQEMVNHGIAAVVREKTYLYSVQRMVSNTSSVANLLRVPSAPVPPCAAMAL